MTSDFRRQFWLPVAIYFFCFAVLTSCFPLLSYAEPLQLAEVESKLTEIRSGITGFRKQMTTLQEQQKRTQKLMVDQKKLVVSLTAEAQRLTDRLKAIVDDRRAAEASVRDAEENKNELQARAGRRLRVLYMASDVSLARGLLERTSVTEVDRTIVYLAKIRASDRNQFQGMLEAASRARTAHERLKTIADEQEAGRIELEEKRNKAEAALISSKDLAKQLATQKDEISKSITSLKREEGRLEALIATITSGGLEPINAEPTQSESDATTPNPTPKVEAKGRDRNPVNEAPDDGPSEVKLTGLFGGNVKIVRPVAGRVVGSFGKTRVGDLREEVFNKGIEYSTAAGSEVKVVADGKAVYIGKLPTFGNVVIFDHGSRSYTLYGRLNTVDVKAGSLLPRGGVMGTTGDPDEQGRNFYFEVRRNGIPVNPNTVLK